jgi:4-amino-4-deoxy-L-arabinose transferase-like glycosyltransferase
MYLIGVILLLFGLFVPASSIIVALRSSPVSQQLSVQLMQGAFLFKICVAALGLLIIALRRQSIWKPNDVAKTSASFAKYPKFDIVILGLILFAAAVLRLYRLDGGLWFDEVVTYVNYVKVPFGEAISLYNDQNQHLLYSVLANVAFLVFGDSEWSLRLPSVLFGVGSIWALYLLGREVSNSREALLSSALLAFSYHHVWFSQNARGYTGLLFFSILASWLFLRALREDRPYLWFAYAAAVAFGAYTLIYMVFVVLGHLLIYGITLYHRRKENWEYRWAGLFLGFFLSGFLTILLHALVIPQFLAAFAHANVGGPIWTQPLWGFLEFIRGMQVNFRGSFAALFALAVFGAGLLHYFRSKPEVVWLLLVPSITCILLKVAMGHHLWPRSLFFVAGFGALIVIRGVMVFGDVLLRIFHKLSSKVSEMFQMKEFSGWVGAVLCAGLVVVSALSVPFAYGPKQDFLGAMSFVEQRREPGDAVVMVGLAAFPYRHLYKTDWKEIESLAALNEVRSHVKRTWLVYTIPIQLQDSFPEIDTSIRQEFKVVKQFYGTLNGGTIFVCQFDANESDLAKLP